MNMTCLLLVFTLRPMLWELQEYLSVSLWVFMKYCLHNMGNILCHTTRNAAYLIQRERKIHSYWINLVKSLTLQLFFLLYGRGCGWLCWSQFKGTSVSHPAIHPTMKSLSRHHSWARLSCSQRAVAEAFFPFC